MKTGYRKGRKESTFYRKIATKIHEEDRRQRTEDGRQRKARCRDAIYRVLGIEGFETMCVNEFP